MATPHISTNFADLLDPRFQRIFEDAYNDGVDMVSTLYTMQAHNGRNNMTWSQVGQLEDFTSFAGSVAYDGLNQGYDTTATYVEFAKGIQTERKLFDDDQHNIMDQRPRALARAAFRTRQKHAARLLNNAFSVDNFFYSNSEAVALCSNSHTTTSGASTANGFDNLGTAALSATAVASARIQMTGYRGDRAERITVVPNELWFPPNLYEEAQEIIQSTWKVDTDLNNVNVHEGRYVPHEWQYLTDTNNWFLSDSSLRGESVFWVDRVPIEFAMVEDFDTLIAKHRAYMRYANAHVDWRWAFGSQVS
jgi:hypothetical protein